MNEQTLQEITDREWKRLPEFIQVTFVSKTAFDLAFAAGWTSALFRVFVAATPAEPETLTLGQTANLLRIGLEEA